MSSKKMEDEEDVLSELVEEHLIYSVGHEARFHMGVPLPSLDDIEGSDWYE